MANPLLMFDIDIEVSHHDDATISADTLFASAELAGLHIALHDVDAVFLIKRDARNLVEADDIVLTDQAPLAIAIVHEHSSDCSFAAGDQMGIRRDLLEQMTLTRSSRTEFHHVVISFYKRDHPDQKD